MSKIGFLENLTQLKKIDPVVIAVGISGPKPFSSNGGFYAKM
jgi:hypothetical protein